MVWGMHARLLRGFRNTTSVVFGLSRRLELHDFMLRTGLDQKFGMHDTEIKLLGLLDKGSSPGSADVVLGQSWMVRSMPAREDLNCPSKGPTVVFDVMKA